MIASGSSGPPRRVLLAPRIRALASHVPIGSGVVADIGTDHATLPVVILRERRATRCIATDLRPKPLGAGALRVRRAGLDAQVELRCGDGFAALQPAEVDVACIAGLGGARMAEMLATDAAAAALARASRLVLNPFSAEWQVRAWLRANGWELELEQEVLDAGELYTILVARRGDAAAPYRDLDCPMPVALHAGPWLLRRPTEATRERWQRELAHVCAVEQHAAGAGVASARLRGVHARRALLESIVAEIERRSLAAPCARVGSANHVT